MNGLSELNTHGSQTVTVSDSRKARIVFESQKTQKDSEISFANGVFTFRITKDLYPFVIQEIINYQTCLPKLYITIKPSSITGSTFTQSLVTPVTSANPNNNLEYVLSGYTNHVDWDNNLEFTWNLPSNISSLKSLFLSFRLVWLDEATGENKEITWDVYDVDYYYVAAFESMFNLESDSIRLVRASSNLVSKFATGAIQGEANLTSAFTATCDGSQVKGGIATFNAYCVSDVASTLIFGGIANLPTKIVQYAKPNRTPFNCQIRVDVANNYKTMNWKVSSYTPNLSFIINYGDGTNQTFSTSSQQSQINVVKTYNTSGLYDVSITDLNNKAIELNVSIDRNAYPNTNSIKLVKIRSWGEPVVTQPIDDLRGRWLDFCYSQNELVDIPEYEPASFFTSTLFSDCNNLNSSNFQYWFQYNSLKNALDPNYYQTIDGYHYLDNVNLFSHCSSFNQPVNNWNVSGLVSLTYMFDRCSSFNQPVNNWDVSNVINMNTVFVGTSFNQPLNNWNVSNVRSMGAMFQESPFNQNINNWNVSNVRSMSYMFYLNSSFNQPLDYWNVSNVINMSYMFEGAINFNQNINSWNVSNVTDMSRMFDSTSFNQPLNNWNVSKVTDMSSMFDGAPTFNQSLNTWNVSNVTNMSRMFEGASKFNQPLNNWNTAKVTNMTYMFNLASTFDQNISTWKVTQIATKPTGFDTGTLASWTTAEKPKWGV